jgi:hypothetical protein
VLLFKSTHPFYSVGREGDREREREGERERENLKLTFNKN